MAQIADLMSLVELQIEGCDVITMQTQLQWSVREFCRRSRFLRQSAEFSVERGVNVYTLTSPIVGTAVLEADAVTVDGRPLDPTSPKEVGPSSLASEPAEIEDETGLPIYGSAEVTHYWYEPPADLVLWPMPSKAAVGAASMILVTTLNSNVVPDAIERKYSDAIASGALSRLFIMPKQVWTDPGLAQYHGSLFNTSIEDAKSEAARQHRRRNYRVVSQS